MKKFLLALLLASPAFAQTKFALFNQAAPAPGGTTGCLVYSTSGAATLGCLTLGTTGFILKSTGSAPAWVDPNTFLTGFVKLQSPGPGSAQTGGFNVNDAATVGIPFTVEPATTGAAGTTTLANFYSNAPGVGSYQEINYGTAAGAGFTQWNWSAPTLGNVPEMGWYKTGGNRYEGLMMRKSGAGTYAACINMEAHPSVVCNGSAEGLLVGHVSTNPGFWVASNGNIITISGNAFAPWIGMSGTPNDVLATDGVGHFIWLAATSLGLGGTVTAISTTLPLTGCSSPCTTTAPLGVSINTTNDGGAIAKQGSTPGVAQTGNTNITGTAIAGSFVGPLTGNASTASVAAAFATTGAAVDVSGSAPPGGIGYVCTTTNATHCTWQLPAGGGTVTSVGNGTIGPLFNATWATATTTPALSFDYNTQSANCVIAGPTTGSPAVPTCRALITGDFPTTGVTASTYGDGSHVAQVSVDATGRLTLVSNVAISGGVGTTIAFQQDQFNGDGVTTAFTVSGTIITNGTAYVALNGLPQPTTAWSVSASTVTMTTAPISGALLAVGYYTALPGSVTHLQEDFAGAGGTDFTLAHTPTVAGGVTLVSLRGLVQPQTSWSIVSSTTLRFSSAVPTGDQVSISYNY